MKQIDSYRRGVCAQHYHVNRLQITSGTWIDLRSYDAMLFPIGAARALVTVMRHNNILGGMPSVKRLLGAEAVRLRSIEYTVTACATGGKIVTEDFKHNFKVQPAFGGWNGLFYLMESPKGNLFTTRHLDDMLRVKVFGAIQGAQFCC
jgi:hypothetical protein